MAYMHGSPARSPDTARIAPTIAAISNKRRAASNAICHVSGGDDRRDMTNGDTR
jgi:hypothetical protein